MKQYGSLQDCVRRTRISAKREYALEKKTVCQGQVLTVDHYQLRITHGKVAEQDIVERPESVLVLPVGQEQTVMLIEEYDLDVDAWQLTLPSRKVIDSTPEGIWQQAQVELREESGFRAGKLEKLLVLRSLRGDRKNYEKVAQAGSTGCSFVFLHLTNAALDFYSHPGYIAHTVHLLVAYGL